MSYLNTSTQSKNIRFYMYLYFSNINVHFGKDNINYVTKPS